MYRIHLKHNLRSAAFLLIFLVVLALPIFLWWVNQKGLPDSWRATIEREVAIQGAYLRIGGLSYLPLRGIVANNVQFFSDPAKTNELSRLQRVILDVDKTKLARGKFRLNKIQLTNANVSLPVDPLDPKSESLELTGVNATVLMPGGRLFEIRNARGKVAGIDVTLAARLLGYQQDNEKDEDPERQGKRREFLAQIIRELENWNFPDRSTPQIRIRIDGDLTDWESFTARFNLNAESIERNAHTIEEISAEGELVGTILTLTKFEASDTRGELMAHADYDLDAREGRFDVQSNLDMTRMVEAWFGLSTPGHVLIGGKQSLVVAGHFRLPEEAPADVRATGHARFESTMIKGVLFDGIESSFAWKEGDLFLRGIRMTRSDGEVNGKAMIQWPLVRLAINTTLPVPCYRPFFVGMPLERVLNDITENSNTSVNVNLEGGFNAKDRFSWAYTGGGTVTNLSYRGVPANSADCQFSMSHHELDFRDGTVIFNYDNYALRKAHGGPNKATAKVGRIRYEAKSKTVAVENVHGAFWAAPMVRFFAPKIANTLENYRFHRPPELKGSGVVDVTPRGRTSLSISFNSPSPASYKFLGEDIVFNQASANVKIRGGTVEVTKLDLPVYDGILTGDFLNDGKGKLSGGLVWTKLSLKDLAATYGVTMEGGGTLTGKIDFSLQNDKVETMQGEGHVGFEDAELFSVPVFGPLSSLISGVTNDKRAGHQRAKNAFFSYKIDQGILSSRDFQTTTSSLIFTGDGTINLNDSTLDMNMRMNARGLLGFITLPLRPFYGLFQFRGSGPLKKPVWENAMFTPPPDPQKEALLKPPRARVVREN